MTKNDFQCGSCPPSWILKKCIWSSGCRLPNRMPHFVEIGWFFIEIWRYNDFSMAALSAISNFRNLEFVTRRVCCRAILLTWNRTKWFLKWWPSTILNFWNVHIWSCDCHRVLSLLLCTKSHENWMIFHWDMAIYRFSRWWPCGMLNF